MNHLEPPMETDDAVLRNIAWCMLNAMLAADDVQADAAMLAIMTGLLGTRIKRGENVTASIKDLRAALKQLENTPLGKQYKKLAIFR